MKKKNTFFSLLTIIIFYWSCKHSPNEELLSDIPVNTINPTQFDSLCYTDHIEPIIQSNCAYSGCHDDTSHIANINLSSYENLIASVSGNLLMQVIQDTGVLGMPLQPNARLSSNQISTIQRWIMEGMKKDIDCQGSCDTTDFTFSTGVAPIIENFCVGCHTNATINLSSYSNIQVYVNDGSLWGSISHNSSYTAMPYNLPQLAPCKLRVIEKWIADGAPNN